MVVGATVVVEVTSSVEGQSSLYSSLVSRIFSSRCEIHGTLKDPLTAVNPVSKAKMTRLVMVIVQAQLPIVWVYGD